MKGKPSAKVGGFSLQNAFQEAVESWKQKGGEILNFNDICITHFAGAGPKEPSSRADFTTGDPGVYSWVNFIIQ